MNQIDFKKKSELAIFISYFKPHKKLFYVDMLCALMIALIDLGFPLVSRMALQNLLPNEAFRAFFVVVTVVVGAFVIRALLYYIVSYWGHTFGIRVEADIRRDLFTHMQTLSYGYFDHNRTGQLMSRLTSDLFEITELAHHGPEDLFISVITIVGSLIIMFAVQWQLALVIALIIPVFLGVLLLQRKDMARTSAKVKQKMGAINTDIESGLSGMRTAKAFSCEVQELNKFEHANAAFKLSKRQFHKSMARFVGTMEFFMCLLSVAVIAVGGYLIMENKMDVVDMVTFTLYVTTFITPIRKLSNFAEMFSNGFAGLVRFTDVMRTDPDLQDAPNATVLGRVKGSITVDNIDFAYDDGTENTLNQVSVQIKQGESVAIVGPSGGGKTTLCQLIPRFYDVTGGKILIDETDVKDVTQESLHKNIGVVQQEVFLFADTILENIRYGTPDATMEQVVVAAKRAEIYEDILQMPDGFETYVGERGTFLSGGQKQRISIARVFLKNPPILILDEATSALDTVTEAKIQRAFDELAKGRTTLIIAHRLSTIRNADRIVVISDGVIKEQGSHGDLLASNGLYAALFLTQTTI